MPSALDSNGEPTPWVDAKWRQANPDWGKPQTHDPQPLSESHGLNGYAHDGDRWQPFTADAAGRARLQALTQTLDQHPRYGGPTPYDVRLHHADQAPQETDSLATTPATRVSVEPYTTTHGSERVPAAIEGQTDTPKNTNDQRYRIVLTGMPDAERLHARLRAAGIGATMGTARQYSSAPDPAQWANRSWPPGPTPTTQDERRAQLETFAETRQPIVIDADRPMTQADMRHLQTQIMERLAADEVGGPRGNRDHREAPLLIRNANGAWTHATLTLESHIPLDQLNAQNMGAGPELVLRIHDPRYAQDLTHGLGPIRQLQGAALHPAMGTVDGTLGADHAQGPPELAQELRRHATLYRDRDWGAGTAPMLPEHGLRPSAVTPTPSLTIHGATAATRDRIMQIAALDARQPAAVRPTEAETEIVRQGIETDSATP